MKVFEINGTDGSFDFNFSKNGWMNEWIGASLISIPSKNQSRWFSKSEGSEQRNGTGGSLELKISCTTLTYDLYMGKQLR